MIIRISMTRGWAKKQAGKRSHLGLRCVVYLNRSDVNRFLMTFEEGGKVRLASVDDAWRCKTLGIMFGIDRPVEPLTPKAR